jgi:hypothetical protein
VLATLSAPAILSAQSADRAVGTWKLNAAKSSYDPGPPPKELTLIFEPSGEGVKVSTKGIDADGKPTATEYTANYDGKDYPATGAPDYNSVVLKRINASTVQTTRKRDGHAVQTVRRMVSKDGKRLTATITGTDTKGRHVKNVNVFDRQ